MIIRPFDQVERMCYNCANPTQVGGGWPLAIERVGSGQGAR